MPTRLVVESSALQSVIKRAGAVAPTTAGKALDQAAGIFLRVRPGTDQQLVIQATDLDTYFSEELQCSLCTGDAVDYRLPSISVAALITKLKTSGEVDVYQENQNRLMFSQGRSKYEFGMMDATTYQSWGHGSGADQVEVNALGQIVNSVAWACANDGVKRGIHFDGEKVVATDGYVMATMPCKTGFERAVTVPWSSVKSIVTPEASANIGLAGGMILICPDSATEVYIPTLSDPFPDLTSYIERSSVTEGRVIVRKKEFTEVVDRLASIHTSSRDLPQMYMTFGDEEISFSLRDQEAALGIDALEFQGQMQHDPVTLSVTPRLFSSALAAAPSEAITLGYAITQNSRNVYIDGGSGYQAFVALREKPKGS